MPYCKNNPKRQYKGTEPSPKGLGYCASGAKVGEKRKGKDGNMWIVKKIKTGSKRWMKTSSSKTKKKSETLDCSKFVVYEKKEKKGFFSKFTTYTTLKGLSSGEKGYIYKFIDFNNFEKTKTKIPDGYKKKKRSTSWVNEFYCDTSKHRLLKNNKEYKKVKKKHKGCKTYFTHDNGGRPFLVYVAKNKVSIYRIPKKRYISDDDWSKKENNNRWMHVELIKKYKSSKIFIGKSPLNDMTRYSGGHGKKFDGNSILIKIKKNRYVFIGWEIYEFTSNEEIKEYYSPVGSNDVPYPVAISDTNVYFMLDYKYVPIDKFELFNKKVKENAYSYYYGHSGEKALEKYSKKMKSVKMILESIY